MLYCDGYFCDKKLTGILETFAAYINQEDWHVSVCL